MKTGRSGKFENNSTLNVKKIWSVGWSVWTIWSASLVFFGIFWFWGVKFSKVKNPGKCLDLQRKCKMLKKKNSRVWIREIVGVLGGRA